MSDEQNNTRYLGKIKNATFQNKTSGESFNKQSIMVDNPNQVNADGTPNQYYKGSLMWFDAATGQYYQVKQIDIAGASANDQARGFTNSLRIDLGNAYHVVKLEN